MLETFEFILRIIWVYYSSFPPFLHYILWLLLFTSVKQDVKKYKKTLEKHKKQNIAMKWLLYGILWNLGNQYIAFNCTSPKNLNNIGC